MIRIYLLAISFLLLHTGLTGQTPNIVDEPVIDNLESKTYYRNTLVKEISFVSELISEFKGEKVEIMASVLLPSSYYLQKNKKYPIRFNIGGFGQSHTRVNDLISDNEFLSWWTSQNAPQVITVFLDARGEYGDNYQFDSENSGPYGESLIKELIPLVEKKYRTYNSSGHRYLDGCSTGGWVSLALQIFYPDEFNGCWSYSADPVTFAHLQLINLYEYDNAFYNSFGYEIPSRRSILGNPEFSIMQEIKDENQKGKNGTYVTSSGQWCAWNALYSPKGEDGLPMAIFDPVSGEIDKRVAQHWKEKDLLLYLNENWSELGPLLQGKLHIWMGDMDEYYLNNAMREFQSFLSATSNPKSDAEITFEAMKGHCSGYNQKDVLEAIWEKYK